ncbi:MAG: hypothetical protein AAF798_01470 [Bacteroidota bacterium]
MNFPIAYENWHVHWSKNRVQLEAEYTSQQRTFVPGLLPELAIQLPAHEVLTLIEQAIGRGVLQDALQAEHTIPSPLTGTTNTQWIKRSNMVGINVRTIGNFFNIVKYILTVPQSQQAIHILPIWEPGVVASLYGMASWHINSEFFSQELYDLYPELDTVEKQLKVVINMLHAMGRVVGMDVIPHTDRYSEIVLANPQYFEWLKREEQEIVDHRANLHEAAQQVIFDLLQEIGSAVEELSLPEDAATFFGVEFGSEKRQALLFGHQYDYHTRGERRGKFVERLYDEGLEPLPATMAPPYRGLQVKKVEAGQNTDSKGRVWYDYEIIEPQSMSRVFGPLSRYKLYERLDDNKNWAIDFERPRKEVWEYVCANYAAVQRDFNFDFMRGDMSHVQMRPDGVPMVVDQYYDIQRGVAKRIQQAVPYFGYFAETFLAPAGYMAFGDEADHLDQSDADVTLGDLQSTVVGSPEFLQAFRWYLDMLATRHFAPCFTMMTGDKDDPRFDKFYLKGNEIRLLLGLFLTDMPSYMGLGFESRDPHPEPAPNEHYTKLYVFKIEAGPKATTGPYIWGKNGQLFRHLSRIRLLAEQILPRISDQSTHWLRQPDPTEGHYLIAWTQAEKPQYLFVVNLNVDQDLTNQKIPIKGTFWELHTAKLLLSTSEAFPEGRLLPKSQKHLQIDHISAGEGLVFELINTT